MSDGVDAEDPGIAVSGVDAEEPGTGEAELVPGMMVAGSGSATATGALVCAAGAAAVMPFPKLLARDGLTESDKSVGIEEKEVGVTTVGEAGASAVMPLPNSFVSIGLTEKFCDDGAWYAYMSVGGRYELNRFVASGDAAVTGNSCDDGAWYESKSVGTNELK